MKGPPTAETVPGPLAHRLPPEVRDQVLQFIEQTCTSPDHRDVFADAWGERLPYKPAPPFILAEKLVGVYEGNVRREDGSIDWYIMGSGIIEAKHPTLMHSFRCFYFRPADSDEYVLEVLDISGKPVVRN